MSSDRPAEITSLLEKAEEVYYNSLDMGEYGSSDCPEAMVRVVLETLLSSGLTDAEKIEKVVQSLRPLSKLLRG